MVKTLLSFMAGLIFSSPLVFSPTVMADSSPTPAASENYLHVHLGDGQALDAPIKSFKGLSLSVLMTLKKQGKLANVQEPGSDPKGYMTFVLNKDVSSGFVAWAKGQGGQNASSGATGEFAWVDSNGKNTEVFKMSGLKVIQFIPADAKGSNGGQVVLEADTQAFPPIPFKSQK